MPPFLCREVRPRFFPRGFPRNLKFNLSGEPLCPFTRTAPARAPFSSPTTQNDAHSNSFKITTYNLIQNKPLHPPVKSITFKKQGGGGVTNQLTPEENECCWRRCAAVSCAPVP